MTVCESCCKQCFRQLSWHEEKLGVKSSVRAAVIRIHGGWRRLERRNLRMGTRMGNTLRSILLIFCLPALALGQQSSGAWKEYVYNNDGFAVTLPSAPTRHADPRIPHTTNYDVSFEEGPFRVAVVDQNRDCGTTLSDLKARLLSGKQPGLDNSSVKEITVAEHSAVEFRHRVANETRYERYVCGDGRFFYFFYAKWPINQSMPTSVNRILSSFRLLQSAK